MDYRYLGASALKVSPLCLGAMMFGGPADEAVSHRIMARAFEQGINFVDTADVYGAGRSEEVVGRGVGARRDDWVIATKFGNPMGGSVNARGQSRKWIVQALEASLRRLGTDYVDILYFHKAFTDAPLEEGVRAMDDLIRAGKLRYYGVSNFRGWRIAEVCRIADQLGAPRPTISQPLYNIVDRTAEVEQIPSAVHFGLGVVPYSPLARGVLTGKYRQGEPPAADSRVARADRRILETEWREESLPIATAVAERAAAKGASPMAFAVAWVLANRHVSAAIAGPRTEAQWDGYDEALRLRLDAEDEAFVDRLVAPGHVSRHGYTDPAYPVEGRRP